MGNAKIGNIAKKTDKKIFFSIQLIF